MHPSKGARLRESAPLKSLAWYCWMAKETKGSFDPRRDQANQEKMTIRLRQNMAVILRSRREARCCNAK
jgi:hypothetical protein